MDLVKHKPLVLIRDVHVGKFGWNEGNVLMGIPLNHPNESLNGKLKYTSTILNINLKDDVVETKNTLYKVVNWKSVETLLRSNKDGE
jgi:hypothetical protein